MHLSVEAYTSQEWFDREQEQIFGACWQFAGLVEDVAERGDVVTTQAGRFNIIVVCGEDRQLRAFHNMCRHRGTQLLRTAGKSRTVITCPYHDWTYSLDGELIGVPQGREEFACLDKSALSLHSASVATWRGMIFVQPEPDAVPLEQWFAEIEPHMGPHQPERLTEYEAGRARHEIAANWKFIDAYHLSHLHAQTLYMYDHSRIESGSVGPHFAFFEPLAPDYLDGVERHSPLPLIDHIPHEQLGAYVPMLFPNLGVSATESAWSTFHVIPLAPDRSVVELRSKVMPVSSWEFAKQAWRSTWSFPWKSGGKSGASDSDDPLASGDFMTEDIYVCEQQQLGMASPRFSVGGSAKNLERGIRNFHNQIQREVLDR